MEDGQSEAGTLSRGRHYQWLESFCEERNKANRIRICIADLLKLH